MLLSTGLALAERELEKLSPYIQRGEIAGSIRREQEHVKDIEIVVVPKVDLFGIPRLPPGIYSPKQYIKNGEKYKQIRLEHDYKLDLFLVTPPADWGVIFTIRTGPDTFSRWVVTRRNKRGALPNYARVRDGAVRYINSDEIIPMKEEIDFLDFLGLGWIKPSKRYARMERKRDAN